MKENTKYNNGEFYEKLDSFLRGNMSPCEESKFKYILQTNPELKQKAFSVARLAKAMAEVGVETDHKIVEEIMEYNLLQVNDIANKACGKNIIHIKPFRKVFIAFSTAASVMLCVFGGYKYSQYDQTTNLGYESLAYYSPSEFTRGVDNEVLEQLNSIRKNLTNKANLSSSIMSLKKMYNESINDEYNDYTVYAPEIGWLLANAYLIDNDRDNALKVLYRLKEEYDAETSFGKSVRDLIAKIEAI